MEISNVESPLAGQDQTLKLT